MSLEYWEKLLVKTSHRIRPCNVYFLQGTLNKKRNGKLICYLDSNGNPIIENNNQPPADAVMVNGYEMTFPVRNNHDNTCIVIIDIDASTKKDQPNIFERLELFCRVKKTLYAERSASGF